MNIDKYIVPEKELRMSEMERYNLKYTLSIDYNNGEGFDRETIIEEHEKNNEVGACDALMLISIIKPEDGSFSMDWISAAIEDKEPMPVSNLDLFRVWSLLSKQVAEISEFEWQRKIAMNAFSNVCKFLSDEEPEQKDGQ